MRRTVLSGIAASALVMAGSLAAAGPARADQLVTAQALATVTGNATPNGSGAGYVAAQTFVAGVGGPLTSVVLNLTKPGMPNADVTVAIEETTGGLPNGTVLASTVIPEADVPSTSTALTEVAFTSPATVVVGTTYAITVASAATTSTYWVGTVLSSTYLDGEALSRVTAGPPWYYNGSDFYFIAYVTTSSAGGDAPPDIIEQFGLPSNGSCTPVPAEVRLNIANRTSGWGVSWTDAAWLNNGAGGPVCVRTLRYNATLQDFAALT